LGLVKEKDFYFPVDKRLGVTADGDTEGHK